MRSLIVSSLYLWFVFGAPAAGADLTHPAQLATPQAACVFSLSRGDVQVDFVISEDEFVWNPEFSRLEFMLQGPQLLVSNGPKGLQAKLSQLIVQFRLVPPFDIFYDYDLEVFPTGMSGDDLIDQQNFVCTIYTSPLELAPGQYMGRMSETNVINELLSDNDGFVQQFAPYNEDPLEYSMTFYRVAASNPPGAEIFQRGFTNLSADSNGSAVSVFLKYPSPPDYIEIELTNMNRFWIDNQFLGTFGDRFRGTRRFTIEENF